MRWWEVARAQAGSISHAQLLQSGLSSATISRLAATGELARASRGIYLTGAAASTWHARIWVALLATGGVLDAPTSGRLWGIHYRPDNTVSVVVARNRSLAARPGVQIRRADLASEQVCVRDNLPMLTRRATVVQLLRVLPWPDASKLADRAVQRGWVDRQACARDLTAYPNRPGNPQLRRLADQLGDGRRHDPSGVLHGLLRRAGISGWRPNHAVWVGGELVAVLDIAIPGARLAIEVDGMAFHVDVDRFQRDRSRQNALVALGWTILRFTWSDLVERPGYVVATIERMARRAVG